MPSRKRESEQNDAHAGVEQTIPIRGGGPPVHRDDRPEPLDRAPTQVLTVLIFGTGDCGELGFGPVTKENTEGHEAFCFDANGTFVKLQHRPYLIPGLMDITHITCGANHALALDTRSRVWAWGVGEQNQLGRRIMQRRVLESYVPHQVEVCRHGAKAIAAGSYHSFAVDKLDNVWGWGLNSFGQAGYAKYAGDPSNTFVPCPMKIPDLCGQGIKMVSGNAHHSAAAAPDGRCFAWGRLDGGQLGVRLSEVQLEDDSLMRRDECSRPRICLRPVAVPQRWQNAQLRFGTMYQLGLGSDDDVETAQLILNKAVRDRVLTWAGTGGQFSMVAGPAWDAT